MLLEVGVLLAAIDVPVLVGWSRQVSKLQINCDRESQGPSHSHIRSSAASSLHFALCAIAVCSAALGTIFTPLSARGQEQERTQTVSESPLQAQVALLSDPSYRVRQLARWRLEQYPFETLAIIEREIANSNHDAGTQLVDILTVFATHSDVSLSVRAMNTLRATASEVSAIGRLAQNSLDAIAGMQEEQAIETLSLHDAFFNVGASFSINAQLTGRDAGLTLHINDRFNGDDDVVQWIRFLRSVETVYFEGERINSQFYEALSHLKNVRNVKLKHVALTIEDLKLLRDLPNLEHLGLNYVDINDSAIDTLLEIPVSGSLRLMGTKISKQGAERLSKQMDEIEVYCGRGGFLGVAMNRSDSIVTRVTNNSAAEKAGIQIHDELTHVNGVPIKHFEDLRSELGNFNAHDTLKIKLKRLGKEVEVEATLTEDMT